LVDFVEEKQVFVTVVARACERELRSSGQPIGSLFNGQEYKYWIKGQTGCPETPIKNYHYALCVTPEERSSYLLRGGSLKSRVIFCSEFT
jgi:hypothetical protein